MDTAAVIVPHRGQWAQAGGATWSGGQGAARPAHLGRGLQCAWPAPRRLPGRRRWCTPKTEAKAHLRTRSTLGEWNPGPGNQLGERGVPASSSLPASPQIPTGTCPATYHAVWTDKATHVLHNADHPQPCLPTEGQLPSHIPHRHRLVTREEPGQANGNPKHSTKGSIKSRKRCPPG